MRATQAEPILEFAGYVLDPRKRLLIGPDAVLINLSSRAFDTLHYLAAHPNELIQKQRLMKAVWPTSVVEENNLNQQISAVRRALGESPGEHRFIVTVTGQGYRFVHDVRRLDAIPVVTESTKGSSETVPEAHSATVRNAETAAAGSAAEVAAPAMPSVRRRRRAWLAAAAAAGVVVLASGVYVLLAGREPQPATATGTPSIAVLPFADVSPDRDQGYFVDGLSEELLNALGKLDGLRVVGRTSSFVFKGRDEDVRRVAATLGVQHVLEGSVRRDGDHLRITARLVEANDGSQRWAETYDRKLGDVFAIQRQIADSVAATLRLSLQPVQAAALSGGTRNVEAYEAYLSAHAVTNNGGSNRAREAIGLLERSVQLDPDFALAWAALAEAYTYAVDFLPSSALPLTPLEVQQRISRAALRAFELAPDAPQTLRSAGMVSMQNHDWAEAERRLRRAVELAGPYDYDANLTYALFLMNVGRPSDAIPYEERAMRAEPLLMRPVAFMAALYEMRGQLDQAETLLLASTRLQGHGSMRQQGLIMVNLARDDRSGLRRLMAKDGACSLLDSPALALEELRSSYADALRTGAHGQLAPVAIFSSFLGDQALSLDALRALGPTTNLHALWRPALREVRRQPGFAQLVRELGLVDYWRESGDWGEFCRETADGEFTCR